jgi:hypothetical protein
VTPYSLIDMYSFYLEDTIAAILLIEVTAADSFQMLETIYHGPWSTLKTEVADFPMNL